MAIKHFISGLFSVLKITGAPMLYRYPYRTSAEGLRSDWSNIGHDLDTALGKLGRHSQHGD